MNLTSRQREFIKNRLRNEPKRVGRKNRFKRSKMKNFLSGNFYPLDVTADKFINDFDLLHTYFSSEASWSSGARRGEISDRKLFRYLRKNFDLDKIRTELTLNGIKSIIYQSHDDDLVEIKFDLKRIDRLNPLPAPDMLVNSLIKKYGEQKIKEAVKRCGL